MSLNVLILITLRKTDFHMTTDIPVTLTALAAQKGDLTVLSLTVPLVVRAGWFDTVAEAASEWEEQDLEPNTDWTW